MQFFVETLYYIQVSRVTENRAHRILQLQAENRRFQKPRMRAKKPTKR